jgi:hypothetical protein
LRDYHENQEEVIMGAFEYGGFGSRRKRNLNLSSRFTEGVPEKEWEEHSSRNEIREESVDQIIDDNINKNPTVSVSFPIPEKSKREATKLTLYVENNYIAKLNELKQSGQIPSYSWLVNELLKQALEPINRN